MVWLIGSGGADCIGCFREIEFANGASATSRSQIADRRYRESGERLQRHRDPQWWFGDIGISDGGSAAARSEWGFGDLEIPRAGSGSIP
jgi:hypothetical protein